MAKFNKEYYEGYMPKVDVPGVITIPWSIRVKCPPRRYLIGQASLRLGINLVFEKFINSPFSRGQA